MTDPLLTLSALARRYCVVVHTVSDCGCHTVELYVGNTKLCEEDKSLTVALANIQRRIDEIEGEQPRSVERI